MKLKFNSLISPSSKGVVCIMHGLFGSSQNWRSLANRLQLETDKNIVCVDLRGHGATGLEYQTESFSSQYRLRYEEMASDVSETLSSIFPSISCDDFNVHLVGHSMGGKVGMTYSLLSQLFPEKGLIPLTTLTVVDIEPRSYEGAMIQKYLTIMLDIEERKITDRKQIQILMSQSIKEASIISFLQTNLYICPEKGHFKFKCSLASIKRDFASLMSFPTLKLSSSNKKNTVPTLVLYGEKSDYVLEREKGFVQTFGSENFSVVGIKDAGHWVHAEKPEPFIKELVAFINKQK